MTNWLWKSNIQGKKRIKDLEENIHKIRIENDDLIKKIRSLKSIQNSHSKELEIYNRDKEYPAKINALSDEIKNLVSKKHDYHNKIANNKKGIESLKHFLENTKTLFNKFKSGMNDGLVCQEIESFLNTLSQELNDKEETILEKVNLGEMAVREMFPGKKRERKTKQEENNVIPDRSLDQRQRGNFSPKKVLLPKIEPRQKLKSVEKQRVNNISNNDVPNYKELASKLKSPKNIKKPGTSGQDQVAVSSKQINNIKTNKLKDIDVNEDEIEIVGHEYENTSNFEYDSLISKRDQLDKMSQNILKNIKDNERLYEKKIKEVEKTIELNKKQLDDLMNENELIRLEIEDMQKLIQLNAEENRIKAEVKNEETKLVVKESNNVSQTRNEILHDLNVLKSEEEKLKKSNKIKVEGDVIPENNEDLNEEKKDDEENCKEKDNTELNELKRKYKVTEVQNTSFNNLQLENASSLILKNFD